MRALPDSSSKSTPNSRVNLQSIGGKKKPIIKQSNPALPNAVQSKMENSFDQDFSRVNIHKNSSKAVQLKAQAFTQGNDIHFAPGRFDPYSTQGQNLLGHELTHVVQQRNGKVNATHNMGNDTAINNQPQLEQEADAFGRQATEGKNISRYGNAQTTTMPTNSAIQRKETTMGGEWDTEKFAVRADMDPYGNVELPSAEARGVDIALKFTPNANVDAEKIGLVQSVISMHQGNVDTRTSQTVQDRSIKSGDDIATDGRTDEGEHIDRSSDRNNPIYGSLSLGVGQGLEDTAMDNNTTPDPNKLGVNLANGENSTYQLGFRHQQNGGWVDEDAKLYDGPTMYNARVNSWQEFETTALAIKGNQKGTYYGSVKWGWRTDATGVHDEIDLDKVNDGIPTSSFMRSAEIWNVTPDSTGADSVDLPVQWMGNVKDTPSLALRDGAGASNQTLADLPLGTSVTVMDDSASWLQVQLDSTQNGITLNQHGRSAVMTGNLLRGYVSGDYIETHADYKR